MIDLTQPRPTSTRHPKAKKLTVDMVINIKAARVQGYTQVFCAEHFGVSQGCISQIDRGLIWADVLATDCPSTQAEKITADKSVLADVLETTKQYRNSQEG